MYQGGFQEAMPNFINGCAPMFNQAPTSFITNIEICMDQALLVIKKMINENLASFEVTREAVDKWDKLMCKESESTAYGLEVSFAWTLVALKGWEVLNSLPFFWSSANTRTTKCTAPTGPSKPPLSTRVPPTR